MRILLPLWLALIITVSRPFGNDAVLVPGQCLIDQKSLLLQLKSSLNFTQSRSKKLSTWNATNDSWEGVTCEGGRVTRLDLSNEYITDGLNSSSSLFRLNYLQSLNLAFNSFRSSEIPVGFANLTNLVYLNLSNAGFVGQVPIELSQLKRLVTLDLSMLYFPGLTPLKLENPGLKTLVGNLSELRELYLDGVNMSTQGTEWCNALPSSLPKLEVLSLSNCFLSGPLDSCSSLVNLSSLSVIRLSDNNLSSTVPEFFIKFSNLTSLTLSYCGLYGYFPQKIFLVRTLQILDLSSNRLLSGSLPEFPHNGSLQTLDLSFTNLSGMLPNSIGNLTKLSRINLANCSFSGPIPNSLANLSQLVYLDFSQNNFNGSIPSLTMSKNLTQIILYDNNLMGKIESTQWKDLLNLVNLDLRHNLLEGSIPASLFTLPSIQKIQLSNNRFSSPLSGSFSNPSNSLEILDLSNNKIGGVLPMSIFEIRRLKYLSLSSNNFSGSLHINLIQQLKNLSYLDLSGNNFSIDATSTGSGRSLFPNMTTLKLASCNLRSLPEFLAYQTELSNLDLSNNQILGRIPKWIWELQNLLFLNLSSNLLDGMEALPPSLSAALTVLDLHENNLQGQMLPSPPYATYLDYSSNNFTLDIPDSINTYLSVAVFFSLSKNNFQGFIPESICNAQYLQVLDLSNNNLTGTIPNCLLMESLKVLNLRNNALNGNISFNFTGTCGLKTLDLSSNQLQGQLPVSLAKCTSLEVLDVGNNLINDMFPCKLKSISSLRVLVLRSNNFHGEVGCPNTNSTWKMLQIVDLSSNEFEGNLPAQCLTSWEAMKDNADLYYIQYPFLQLSGLYYEDTVSVTFKGLELELVKILTIFTLIDFSSNKLEGPIPDELGDLKSLCGLNLSHNAFSGPIPSSLGNLQQLESLDLSKNSLIGKIPMQLSDLTFLTFLNLSYNQIEGPIPVAKQFATFTNSSYEGNAGLCGAPLNTICSETNRSSDQGRNLEGMNFDWQFIFVGLGFGAGAAVVVTPLTVWKKGQKWYDEQVDRLCGMIFQLFGWKHGSYYDDEIEEEGTYDKSSKYICGGFGDDKFDGDEEEEEEEESWGRYCVFCSKLDPSKKKVVHDTKCTCYVTPPISSSSSSSSPSSSYSSSSSS